MWAVAIVASWVGMATIPQAPRGSCSDIDLKALEVMERIVSWGDAAAVSEAARRERDTTAACPQLALARLALLGFQEARALAAFGGAVESQGPTRRALEAVAKLRGGSQDLEIEYAETAIRAAIAAAQDERPELDLLLTHARDLTERLNSRARRAIWPRPFNVLAGELWFEVDRFDEARRAYERAVATDASPVAIAGLAHAHLRLGHRADACRTFARVPVDAISLRAGLRQDFAECR